MDYNNLETTTYADIAAAFERTAKRLEARTSCTEPGASKWSDFERVTSAIPKDDIATNAVPPYWNEPIAYTVRKETYWLNAMVGLMTTSGRAPRDWLTSSTVIRQRTWRLHDFEGVDVKGKLRSGNHWRYFGQCGDFLSYYDVPGEAAAYFDGIIDRVYFHAGH